MTAVLCPHFHSRKFQLSNLASMLILFLLAGPGSTIALGPDRLSAGLQGRVRREAMVRSGVKDKAYIGGESETAVRQDRDIWGSSDTTAGSRSMLSIDEDGLWEPWSSSRCFPIPSNMALCQNIGYDTMRMPNLLGHESPAEAVQQSASWLPLLARECHPDARIFLCSLFAPICLER